VFDFLSLLSHNSDDDDHEEFLASAGEARWGLAKKEQPASESELEKVRFEPRWHPLLEEARSKVNCELIHKKSEK